jgi:hypothetical protein
MKIEKTILLSLLSSASVGLYFCIFYKLYEPYYVWKIFPAIIFLCTTFISVLFIIFFIKYYIKTSLIKYIMHKIVIICVILNTFFNFSYYFFLFFEKYIFLAIPGIILILNIPTILFHYFFTSITLYYKIPYIINMFMTIFFTVLPNILIMSLIINKLDYKNNSQKRIMLLFYLQSINYLDIAISMFYLSKYM